jgi:lysophospholipase L1-like esterase
MKYLTYLFIILLGFTSAGVHAQEGADLKSIHKILFVGDSITRHEGAPQIGWTGNWGMAASSEDKDWVHLFLAKLAAAQGAGAPAPTVWVFAEGGGKITDKTRELAKVTAFQADLALVQLGENDKEPTVAAFQQPYEQLLAGIQAGNPKVRILCVGVWGMYPGGDHTKDNMIKAACEKYGATFADLGAAYANEANRASASHVYPNPAVGWHPGDGGMAAYADAFWKALLTPPSAPNPAAEMPASPPPATPSPAPAATGPAPAATPAAASDGQPVEVDETWSTPPVLAWDPMPTIEQQDGRNVAKIFAATTAGAKCQAPLDLSKFAGREVTIHTRIKADSVSEKPKPWNGIKLTLRIQNAEGKLDYPDYRPPTGTFDWQDVTWKVRIPDNVVSVNLVIGLEDVSGTVWYDGIQISAGK